MSRKTTIPTLILAITLIATGAPVASAQETTGTTIRPLAVETLATLTVTETQEDVDGYTQDSFKYPKTRSDLGSKADQWDWVMQRDFDKTTLQTDKGNVTYGELRNDPYSGQTITYQGKAGAVDIEHIVARSEAWDSGASKWTQEQRDEFANDPLEVMAVNASGNRSHGEKDAANWLPSSGSPLFPNGNPSYDCKYVARQIAVKAKWKLTVDQAEHDAMAKTLESCPVQTIPLDTDGEYWDDNPSDTPVKTGDVNGDGKYTTADLTSVRVYANGELVGKFDPTDSAPVAVARNATITTEGLPSGWRDMPVAKQDGSGITIGMVAPDGQTIITYVFTYEADAAKYSADDLRNLKLVYEGKVLTLTEGGVTVADPSKVEFSGVPSGWQVNLETLRDGTVKAAVTAPDGSFMQIIYIRKQTASTASQTASTADNGDGTANGLAKTGTGVTGAFTAFLALFVVGGLMCGARIARKYRRVLE